MDNTLENEKKLKKKEYNKNYRSKLKEHKNDIVQEISPEINEISTKNEEISTKNNEITTTINEIEEIYSETESETESEMESESGDEKEEHVSIRKDDLKELLKRLRKLEEKGKPIQEKEKSNDSFFFAVLKKTALLAIPVVIARHGPMLLETFIKQRRNRQPVSLPAPPIQQPVEQPTQYIQLVDPSAQHSAF
jgi:cell division protein ZapA (FtsZ GTPase activity inhibitor)